ncbi:MAG: translocation/assembly module TamB [Bacteroidales bacterium]|nr:translocation/assembly module TamB [Bacteroidales bacterium]
MRVLQQILKYFCILVALALLAAVILVQLPNVQKELAQYAVEQLKDRIQADINIEKLAFKPFNTLLAHNVSLIDRNPSSEVEKDTILHIGTIKARFSLLGLIGPGHEDIRFKTLRIYDGVLNLAIEDSGIYATNLTRVLGIKRPTSVKEPGTKDVFRTNELSIENLEVNLLNLKSGIREPRGTAINWTDASFRDINLKAGMFGISKGKFSAKVKEFTFNEKSGLEITHMSTDLHFGCGDAVAANTVIRDSKGSELNLDLQILGHSVDFHDFSNKVIISADMGKNRICLSTLAHFVPVLQQSDRTFISFDGNIRGIMKDLNVNRASLHVDGTNLGTSIRGKLSGLPSRDSLYVDMKMERTRVNTRELADFLRIAVNKNLSIHRYGRGEIMYTDLAVKGRPAQLLDVVFNLQLGKKDGKARIETKLGGLLNRDLENSFAKLVLKSDALNLAKLLDRDDLGLLSMRGGISAALNDRKSIKRLSIDSLFIDRIDYNGYSYNSITADAELNGKDINANLSIDDPNCDAELNIWSDKYSYNGALKLRDANLKAMNIDKRDKSDISFNLYSHLDRDLKNLQGNAVISDILLENHIGPQIVSDINISAASTAGMYDISLDSEEMTGHFTGNRKQMDVKLDIHNTTNILAYLMPGAYIDSNTSIDVSKSPEGRVNGNIRTHRLAIRDNYIKDLSGFIHGTMEDLDVDFQADEIHTSAFSLSNNKLSVCILDSLATLHYSFANEDEYASDSDISMKAILEGRRDISLSIDPSHICFRGSRWEIPSSRISLRGKDISVENFSVSNGSQSVHINGRTSQSRKESLSAKLHNINLSTLNYFIDKWDLDIKGVLSMEGEIVSPFSKDIAPEMYLNIVADSLGMGGVDLGRFVAACEYDQTEHHFNIIANNRIGARTPLMANGVYHPGSGKLDTRLSFDNFPLDYAQRIIPNVVSRLQADFNGDILLEGEAGRLNISSERARINGGQFTVNFTDVPYDFDAALIVNNSGIHIVEGRIRDRYATSATVSGGVLWDRMRNIRMNAHVNTNGAELVNIPSHKAKLFYGQIFGEGTVDFTGPLKNITMTVNATSVKNSNINFPISKKATVGSANLLTFVDPSVRRDDPYEAMLSSYRKYNSGNEFIVKLHTMANPNLNVRLDMGNNLFSASLNGTGNGTIDIDFNAATKEYRMDGDYTINEGRVLVNVSNLVRRNLQLREGGSVRFGGSVFDSKVDVTADYKTKTSLDVLIAEKEAISNSRDVECEIHVTDRLSDPSVKFNIEIPDLSPDVRSMVESALSTEDKMQKQFFSLMLTNSFIPDEQGGVFNNNNILFSNLSEIMASQVNNIMNRLDIPLDLGLKYQSTETGANLFDIAVSTQLFNKRVIIGGNFGNKQNIASRSGTMFGDLDIQYKVNRPGTFRIKAFSHSADQYTNYLDNAQRNGVGISWQQEFDSFPKWFRYLFSPKAQKERLRQEEALSTKDKTTIILDE